MIFEKTKIDGVFIINPGPRIDERGYFARIFCKDELSKQGVSFEIMQINRSLTKKKGTIRGLHYQEKPKEEDKIVQCISGAIFDVALDIRRDSPTYGQYIGVELTRDNMSQLLIPKGVAHGFQSLEDNAVVEYVVSEFYSPEHERGVRWNDPMFNIRWPLSDPILSQKDENWPDWS